MKSRLKASAGSGDTAYKNIFLRKCAQVDAS